MHKDLKISIIGVGYVGLSIAAVFSEKANIKIFDKDKEKLNLISKGLSPILENDLIKLIKKNYSRIQVSSSLEDCVYDSDLAILALPTSFDEESNSFNTLILEEVLQEVERINPKALKIIKSTIPIGFTSKMNAKLETNKIIFVPEFLREGKSVFDNYYPQRIIIGSDSRIRSIQNFITFQKKVVKLKKVTFLKMCSSEAEAVKLFSNTFLALRVAFFNEIDSFALSKELSAKNIIDGMSLDPRIGAFYNNPSFGFGGYCLPKDSKQTLTSFTGVDQKIISAIIESNYLRKRLIAKDINASKHSIIGIYRLSMKKDSDNFRESAILEVINMLDPIKKVVIYEPLLNSKSFNGIDLNNNFEDFASSCELIIANRYHNELKPYSRKIYTRDIYQSD